LETAAVIEYGNYKQPHLRHCIAAQKKLQELASWHESVPDSVGIIRVTFCRFCHKTQRTLFAALADSFLKEV